MNCTQCGNPLESGERFCGNCGYSVTPEPPASEPAPPIEGSISSVIVDESPKPTLKWNLGFESGGGEDKPFLLGERVLLGRESDCDVQLDDSEASRRHAIIEKIGEGYTLTDQNSTNGTFVNEERVSGAVKLKTGDKIRIGGTIFYLSSTWEADTVVCPSCGASLSPGAMFCGDCGYQISAAREPAQSTPEIQSPEIDANSQLQPGSEAPPPINLKKIYAPRKGLMIGCGVLLVLFVVGACFVFSIPLQINVLEWLIDMLYEVRYIFF